MPAYTYRCPSCGYTAEVRHSITEVKHYDCPHCCEGGDFRKPPVRLRRVITGGLGFITPGEDFEKPGRLG